MEQNMEYLYNELKESIDKKYDEVQSLIDTSKKFYKIYQLEGNAVGQIGEEFIKKIVSGIVPVETHIDETIHDEYDVKTKSGITIEVKTARYGRNGSFQFNGINPSYNVDYIICLGICEDDAVYRIIKKRDEVSYNHEKNRRGWYVTNPDFTKKLVQMNPGNDVNLKLTLSLNQLYEIDSLVETLKRILKSKKSQRTSNIYYHIDHIENLNIGDNVENKFS